MDEPIQHYKKIRNTLTLRETDESNEVDKDSDDNFTDEVDEELEETE